MMLPLSDNVNHNVATKTQLLPSTGWLHELKHTLLVLASTSSAFSDRQTDRQTDNHAHRKDPICGRQTDKTVRQKHFL